MLSLWGYVQDQCLLKVIRKNGQVKRVGGSPVKLLGGGQQKKITLIRFMKRKKGDEIYTEKRGQKLEKMLESRSVNQADKRARTPFSGER